MVQTILVAFRCEEISLTTSATLVRRAASWEIMAALTLLIIVISSRIKGRSEFHLLIMLNNSFSTIGMAIKC